MENHGNPSSQTDSQTTPGTLLDKNPPFKARYKKRDPDPDLCIVLSIDWEEQRLVMTNGACRYFPSFNEVELIAPETGKDT